MPFESRSLMLFDFSTQKWEEIAKISCGFPNWSKNSDYVYFLHEENDPSVMRVRLRDHKVERVADLKNFRDKRLLQRLAELGPRRLAASAPRHRHPGNLLAGLGNSVTAPFRRSKLLQRSLTFAIRPNSKKNFARGAGEFCGCKRRLREAAADYRDCFGRGRHDSSTTIVFIVMENVESV